MRKRIRTIRSEKVSSSNARVRNQLQRAYALGVDTPAIQRKDSSFLPDVLPDHVRGGLLWD